MFDILQTESQKETLLQSKFVIQIKMLGFIKKNRKQSKTSNNFSDSSGWIVTA
jgi:hypothetical protein